MKRIALALSILSILACKKQIDEDVVNPNPTSMAEMQVADGFNYATSTTLTGMVSVKDLDDNAMPGVRIDIYDALPENGGLLLSSGITDQHGTYAPFGVLPLHVQNVVVRCHAL